MRIRIRNTGVKALLILVQEIPFCQHNQMISHPHLLKNNADAAQQLSRLIEKGKLVAILLLVFKTSYQFLWIPSFV